MVNFTNDDILLYIHNELSADKATALETALLNDWSLREKYTLLSTTQMQISASESYVSPSKRVLNNILQYAKETAVERVA